MTPGPQPREGLEALSAYVPGASLPGALKLSANESPLGPSPSAIDAYRAAASGLAAYPDGAAGILCDALAERCGAARAQIICGNGSDEILALIAQAYLRPGDEALIPAHTFSVYEITARLAGAAVVHARMPGLAITADALLRQLTERTRVVFLANPNNPTGMLMSQADVARLHAGLPEHVLLVLDGAYAEYVAVPDYDAGLALARSAPNVVMTRTFSKLYGLAALRLGWAVGPEPIIRILNAIRAPFNVSVPAQAAGLAALRDAAHADAARAHNARWRPWLAERLEEAGYTVLPSEGNFLFLRVPGGDAAGADAALRAAGLVVRKTASFGLPDGLRITIGPEAGLRKLAEVLAAFRGRMDTVL